MMRKTKSSPCRLLLGAAFLAVAVACGGGGGGGGTTTATTLFFTPDPAATPADWRVEADPATNGTGTVLLRVYGPTGLTIQGTTIFLSCNPSVAVWFQPTGATDPYALAGDALTIEAPPTVSLFKSRQSTAGNLQVAAYQKTGTATLAADRPLFTVALKVSAGVIPASTVEILATPGKESIYLEVDPDPGVVPEQTLTMKLGTLVAE